MEGHLTMSKKERARLVVMAKVMKSEMKISEASELLGLSYRQTFRIAKRYGAEGAVGLVHRSRGRASNRAWDDGEKRKILERCSERYAGYGPTFTVEKLEGDGYGVDHETLRRWLIREGLWQKRRRRKAHRQWRARKEHFGELVQMDGSPHHWFGPDGQTACLLNMIDDAQGTVFALLDREETTAIAMRALWGCEPCEGWIERYGIPKALYVDFKNVYITTREPTIEEQLRGEDPLTQFGKACKKLGIEILGAHSPQAKGRVERSNGVHQDRLVKELQLAGISDLNKANAFLMETYLDGHNKRFTVTAKSRVDFHRPVPKGLDLRTVFCIEEERHVNNDWTVRFNNRYFQILKENDRLPRPGDKITVSEWLDGSIHLLYKGCELQYRVLPERPERPAPPKVRPSLPRKKPTPGPDHPWRQWQGQHKINPVCVKELAGGTKESPR